MNLNFNPHPSTQGEQVGAIAKRVSRSRWLNDDVSINLPLKKVFIKDVVKLENEGIKFENQDIKFENEAPKFQQQHNLRFKTLFKVANPEELSFLINKINNNALPSILTHQLQKDFAIHIDVRNFSLGNNESSIAEEYSKCPKLQKGKDMLVRFGFVVYENSDLSWLLEQIENDKLPDFIHDFKWKLCIDNDRGGGSLNTGVLTLMIICMT